MPHNFQSKKANNKAGSASDDRLPGRPRPRFLLAHHPESFEFVGGKWLPMLKTIPLIPGVNGCRNGANGHQPVIVELRNNRWVPLDEDMSIKVTDPDTGDIVDDEGYMEEWEGKKGPHFSDAWCNPMLVGSGKAASVDWNTGFDHAGYNAWRAWLIEEGHIKPPSPAVLARLTKIQEKRANRRIHESHDGNPHIQAQVKAGLDKLAAMNAAAPEEKKRPVKAKKRKAGAANA